VKTINTTLSKVYSVLLLVSFLMFYEFIPVLPPFGIVLLFENPVIALTVSSLLGIICEILLFNFRPVL